MAVGFVANAQGGNGQSSTTNSLAIVVPSGAAAGQYAVLTVGSTNDTVTLSTPSGWTLLSGPDRVGTNASGWLFGKTLTAPDVGATVTLSFSSAQRCSAHMAVYSGVTSTSLLTGKRVESTSAGTTTLPSVGSVQSGALVHVGWVRRFGGTPAPNVTAPSGYTQGANNRTATGYGNSPELSVESAYETAATTGTYGGESASVSSNSIGVNYLVALRASVTSVSITGVVASATASAAAGLVSNGTTTIDGAVARATANALAGYITGGFVPVTQPAQTWPPEPYRDAIRSGLTITYAADASLSGQPVLGASDLVPSGGSITETNRPGVRATLDWQMPDDTGDLFARLTPSGTRLAVSCTVRYTDRSTLTLPMGVFVVDTIRLSEGSGQLSITAPDKWVTIQRAKFLKPQTSNKGSRIVDQIILLMRGALGASEAAIVKTTSTAKMGHVVWDRDRDQAIIDLADQIGCWAFFDRDGVFTIAPTPRVGAQASWLIDASASGVLTDIDREQSRADAANVVVVESSASDSAHFDTVYVWDSDPQSPTYAGPDPVNQPDAAGPFGIVAVFESSPNLTSTDDANEYGGAVLARSTGLASQVSLEDVPNPAIMPNDVIDVLPPGQEPTGATAVDGFGVGGFGTSGFGIADEFRVSYRSTREVERHVVDTVTHPLDVDTAQRIEGRSIPIVAAPGTGGSTTPPPPVTTATIFGYNTNEFDTAQQTLAGRQAFWGRAPMVRRYMSGMLPASFQYTTSVCPEKRVSASFKADSSGTYTRAGLASGAGNSRMVSWLNSIPAGWTVHWTYHHEPNDELRAGTLTQANFTATYTQMRAALNSATLASGVVVKIVPIFMGYRVTDAAYWSDSWVPAKANMDILGWDVYGNPGQNTSGSGSNKYGTATGSGYGSTYPLPEVRYQPVFDIISRLGMAQHWGIYEVNSPARTWDTNETARARWFTDTYNLFLSQTYAPEVVLLWEAPSGGNWDQSFGRVSHSPTPCANALYPFIHNSV